MEYEIWNTVHGLAIKFNDKTTNEICELCDKLDGLQGFNVTEWRRHYATKSTLILLYYSGKSENPKGELERIMDNI